MNEPIDNISNIIPRTLNGAKNTKMEKKIISTVNIFQITTKDFDMAVEISEVLGLKLFTKGKPISRIRSQAKFHLKLPVNLSPKYTIIDTAKETQPQTRSGMRDPNIILWRVSFIILPMISRLSFGYILLCDLANANLQIS